MPGSSTAGIGAPRYVRPADVICRQWLTIVGVGVTVSGTYHIDVVIWQCTAMLPYGLQ